MGMSFYIEDDHGYRGRRGGYYEPRYYGGPDILDLPSEITFGPRRPRPYYMEPPRRYYYERGTEVGLSMDRNGIGFSFGQEGRHGFSRFNLRFNLDDERQAPPPPPQRELPPEVTLADPEPPKAAPAPVTPPPAAPATPPPSGKHPSDATSAPVNPPPARHPVHHRRPKPAKHQTTCPGGPILTDEQKEILDLYGQLKNAKTKQDADAIKAKIKKIEDKYKVPTPPDKHDTQRSSQAQQDSSATEGAPPAQQEASFFGPAELKFSIVAASVLQEPPVQLALYGYQLYKGW